MENLTDKEQIIVDDCKVEECVNFRDEVSIDSTVLKNACSIGLWQRHYKNLEESCKMSCKCDENPNCYFKQFARKTQECEELKGKYKNVLDLAKQNADANEYCLQELEQENYCYRKALEDIEDITQNHIINDFSNWNMGEISDDIVADYILANCKQILDIINKAKGEINE